ncbi:MAG: DUF262 domain-containing protein [Candidatus Verstraetearchaeota archaeon]|nr:DUF262 domain-containing protein [Candidatus Verstraetearchaeota archaeon]
MISERIIEAKEVSLATLFSEEFIFEIPIFQRPLSWNEDNFEQLIEDIKDSMSLEEGHFLGSIILQHKQGNLYDLIDGQQRMAALTILFAVIRDITKNPELRDTIQSYIYQRKDPYKGFPEAMRVTPWEDLKDMFRQYVYTPGGTKKFLEDFRNRRISYKNADDPVYHLFEAINTFTSKLGEIDLESLVKHMLHKIYVVCIKTRNLATAYRLFNILNTRGLPLSPSDLLKSENLGVIEDEEERKKYAVIWREIENEIGREELTNVISYIRMIKRKEKAKLGIYEEYQKLFKDKLLERGVKFIKYVKEIADIYNQKVLNPEIRLKNKENENRYENIVDLMREFLPFSDWIPPLIAFYYKFKNDEELVDFLLKLEKKFVTEWIAGFTATERITASGKLIELIEKCSNAREVMDKMLKPPIYTFSEYGYKNEEELLRDKLNDVGFYRLRGGNLAKYILLRIDMEEWELENFPGYRNIREITVEHILPQNPAENSEWVKIFTKDQRDEWTNKLGNLVLLSGRKNSRAQNYDFKRKKEVYFKPKCTPFRITQELENVNEWNIENLSSRHKRLIEKCISIYCK